MQWTKFQVNCSLQKKSQSSKSTIQSRQENFLREPQSFLRGDKNTEDGDKTGSQNGGHTAGIDLKFF